MSQPLLVFLKGILATLTERINMSIEEIVEYLDAVNDFAEGMTDDDLYRMDITVRVFADRWGFNIG